MILARLGALVVLCCLLSGCDPVAWTLAGTVIDIGLHGYELAGRVTAGTAQGIDIQCRALAAKEAALNAKGEGAKVAATEKWSGASAVCNPANPPPVDPIAAAFWLGTVIAALGD